MDDYLTRHETENLIGKVAGMLLFALTDGEPELLERTLARLTLVARDREISKAVRRIFAIISDDNQALADLGIAVASDEVPRRLFEVIDGRGGPTCVWAQFDDDSPSAA